MSTLGTIPEAREEEDFFAKPSTPTKGNPKQFTPMFVSVLLAVFSVNFLTKY